MDYFIVELSNGENLAIPLTEIQEVIAVNYSQICPIPGVPQSLLGIVSQKGNLLWLLDLSVLLQNIYTMVNKWESLTVLITKLEKNAIGLVVKKLGKIEDFSQEQFLDKNNDFNNLKIDYIDGLVNDDVNLLPILNLGKIQNYLNSYQSKFTNV